MKKVLLYTVIILSGYLVAGYFIHLVVLPDHKPEISTYFEPGDIFFSKAEGVRQIVTGQEHGLVFCRLVIEPYAMGPPKHIHSKFDEIYEISNGELTVLFGKELIKLVPGERLFIQRGVPHTFYNETADTIYFSQTLDLPEEFAFYLGQIYAIMDNIPDFGKMPETLFRMIPLQRSGFDSYLVEGPPVFVQKALGFLLLPVSRMMGYRAYYPEFDIKPLALQRDE